MKTISSKEKKPKKAQMEIMGLAVIVILLAIGIFFITKFTLLKEQPSQAQSYQQKQVASSFLSTLLSSNAGCPGSSATFSDLIEELTNPQFSSLICGDGTLTLREYFNSAVSSILNQTLDVWGHKYELDVIFPSTVSSDVENIVMNRGCLPTSQIDPSSYYIPSDYGTIKVQMKICY